MGRPAHIQVNADYFEVIDTQEKAYWLGYIYADGHAAIKAPWVVILQSADVDHVQRFADAVEYTGEVKPIEGSGFNEDAKHGRLVICRKKMCDDLNRWGRNETFMEIPKIDPELVRHFIRGYFDGDGSVYLAKSTAKTTAGNKKQYRYLHVQMIGEQWFLEEIEALLLKQGITSYWKDSKTDYMKYLNISGGHNLRKLHEYLYGGSIIQLPRKAQKWEALHAPYGGNAV